LCFNHILSFSKVGYQVGGLGFFLAVKTAPMAAVAPTPMPRFVQFKGRFMILEVSM
jgi:hypothetical protein